MHLRDNSDVGRRGRLSDKRTESTCHSDSVGWCGRGYDIMQSQNCKTFNCDWWLNYRVNRADNKDVI